MNKQIADQPICKDDQDLITLAIKCKFITSEQENKLLTHFLSCLQKKPDYSVEQAFRDLKLFAEDEMAFLLSIKNHLANKLLDIKFGKLAVVNSFTTTDVIDKALKQQTSHFRKTRQHIPLGDMLVKNKHICEKDKTAILLTQDRIADDFLAQAMNTLAADELDKLSTNKRFGSIAVSKGYLSIQDINQALKLQKTQKDKHGKPKFIGRILEESFGLSAQTTIEILKEQKIFEKRRLNLEQALFKYNSEIKTNQTLSKIFEYRVSKDKLEAYVRIAHAYTEEIRAHSLINWIKLMGIRYGFIDNQAIEAFLSEGKPGSELKIAQGNPPQTGEDARVEFYFNHNEDLTQQGKNDGNPKKSRQIVRTGDKLAKRTPHTAGIPGKNVFNQTIAPPKVKTFEFKCGKGVVLQDNGLYTASIEGHPALYDNHSLFVTPLAFKKEYVNLSGPVTAQLGNAYQMHDLKIDGKIEKNTILRCQKLDLVGDVIGDIQAAGDITIQGAVGVASGNGTPMEIQPFIQTQGSVKVSKAVANARVECGQFFQAPNADVIDSEISARHGIYANNVYSNPTRPTVLKIGHVMNTELGAVQMLIDETISQLDELRQRSHIKEMEQKFYQQIQVQDEYRERQNALAYLIKIMGNLDMDNVDTLGPGFDFMETPEEITEDGTISYGIPQKTKAYEYLQIVQDKIENDPPKIQLKRVHKLNEENLGLYKAAASATERMEKEFAIKTDLINQKIKEKQSLIDEKEKKLNELILQKHYLHLQHTMRGIGKTAEIRIKNQISQGTVVVGNNSKLIIDKTIYGVKFRETKDRLSNQFKIVIEGYFE
ncbi:MAG: flagellar assembly protein A [Pseudomonadota bacterium]